MLGLQNALEMEVALIKDSPLCVGLKVTYAVKPEQWDSDGGEAIRD